MTRYEHLISTEQLSECLQYDNWRVIDCRFDLMDPDKGYAEYIAAHIPGALYANLDVDLAAPIVAGSGRHPLPDIDRFVATLCSWGIGGASQVVVYDQNNGAIAARLWWMLNWLGHSAVAILDGGLDAWQRGSRDLESARPVMQSENFVARPDPSRVIASEELQARLCRPEGYTLVDAREEQRFLGQVEPIDSVAGHIPGAVNFPLSSSMTANGTWKRPKLLRSAWRELLQTPPESDWAVMCGSGVTACHIALSARIAGLEHPRLYVGSWSEWIRDASRPVATGDASGSADQR